MTGRPHPHISRATGRPAGSPIDASRALPPVRQLWISSLSLAYPPCPCPHGCYFLKVLMIYVSYFKAPLATSKSRQATSEDACTLFISRCRYADNEYKSCYAERSNGIKGHSCGVARAYITYACAHAVGADFSLAGMQDFSLAHMQESTEWL